MSRIIISILFLGFFSINSCKSTTSQVQSLDNLTKGDGELQRNVCQSETVNPTAEEVSKDRTLVQFQDGIDDKFRTIVAKALSSVPENHLKFLFSKKLDVHLIYTPKATEYCSGNVDASIYNKSGAGALSICMIPDGQTSVPRVFISTNIESTRAQFPDLKDNSDDEVISSAIANSTVQALGVVFSGWVTKLSVVPNSPDTLNIDGGDKLLEKNRDDLTWQFLNDAALNGMDIGMYKGFLQNADKVLDTKLDPNERYRQYFIQHSTWDGKVATPKQDGDDSSEQWPKRARVLMDIVFANTYDSYYCNSKTKETLSGDGGLVNTGRLFAGTIAPELEAAFDMNINTVASASDTSETDGIALVGESKRSKGTKMSKLKAPVVEPGSTALAGRILFGGLRLVGRTVLGVGQVAVNTGGRVLYRGAQVLRFVNGGPIGWRRQQFMGNHYGMGPVRFFVGAPIRWIARRRG